MKEKTVAPRLINIQQKPPHLEQIFLLFSQNTTCWHKQDNMLLLYGLC